MEIGKVFEELRDKGLKCICSDCDAFGCDYCTVCRLDDDTAKGLLNSIKLLEVSYHVKIVNLQSDRRY